MFSEINIIRLNINQIKIHHDYVLCKITIRAPSVRCFKRRFALTVFLTASQSRILYFPLSNNEQNVLH